MHPYTYIVSLRATHPTEEPSVLTSLLGMQPTRSWLAGEARTTPKGASLGGSRANSYWAARLIEGEISSEVSEVEDTLDQVVSRLSAHAVSLGAFSKTGGSLILYLSLFGAQNFGLTLSPALLARISALNLELDLDVYPESK